MFWRRSKRVGAIPKGADGARWTVGRSLIEVGRFTYGHDRMTVRQWKEGATLRIGDFCSIAEGLTVFLGGAHRTDWITTFPFGHVFAEDLGGTDIVGHPATRGDVIIGSDVWIASNVTILSGVTIGDGAVIGGNATVTRDVGPYEVWAGNPARKIRDRFSPEIAARLCAMKWWTHDIEKIRIIAPLLSTEPTPEGLDQIRDILDVV